MKEMTGLVFAVRINTRGGCAPCSTMGVTAGNVVPCADVADIDHLARRGGGACTKNAAVKIGIKKKSRMEKFSQVCKTSLAW